MSVNGINFDDLRKKAMEAASQAAAKAAQTQQNDGVNGKNASSVTVIKNGGQAESTKPNNSSVKTSNYNNLEEIISDQYNKNLTTGQKDALAASILDNNRSEMMDAVNKAYKETQIMAELGEREDAYEIAQKIANGEEIKESDYPNLTSKQINEIKNKEYEKFDKNTPADKIPSELIYLADLPDANITLPDLSTFNDKDLEGNQVSNIAEYNSKAKELDIDLSKYETDEEKLEALSDAIAKNYGLVDEKGNALSLNSIQGANVLNALYGEEGNNEIFDGKAQDVNKALSQILESASDGKISLACPNTTVSVLSDEAMSDADLKAYVEKEGYDKNISSLHATNNFVDMTTSDAKNITAKDLLDNIEYKEGQSLKDAVENASEEEKEAMEALGKSAIQQIAQNNPALAKYIENHPDLTTEELFNLNIQDAMAEANQGLNPYEQYDTSKVIIEDVQLMTDKPVEQAPAATPKQVAEEPVPEATEPEPTSSIPEEDPPKTETVTVTDHVTETTTVTDHVTDTVTDHVTETATITDHVTETIPVTEDVIETEFVTETITVTDEITETTTVTDHVTDTVTVTEVVTETVTPEPCPPGPEVTPSTTPLPDDEDDEMPITTPVENPEDTPPAQEVKPDENSQIKASDDSQDISPEVGGSQANFSNEIEQEISNIADWLKEMEEQ